MAGLDGGSSSELFSVGSEVEVRSDEEGFKGAWFRATVIQSPTNSDSASKTKKKRALVEYKTLVTTEDASQQLREYVDYDYMRPLPPQLPNQEHHLQEGHIVDADYRDGWWTGVVRKVIKDNSEYSVVFENPPDVLEFDGERLRLHQDWVAGVWHRPKKQEILGASDSQQKKVDVLPIEHNSNHPHLAAQQTNSAAVGDNPELANSRKNLLEQSSNTQSIKDVARNGIESRPLKKFKDDKVSEARSSVTPRQLSKMPGDKEMLDELATATKKSSVNRARRICKPVISHQLYEVQGMNGKKSKTNDEKDGEPNNQWILSVKRKRRRTKSQNESSQEAVVYALPSQERHKEKGKEGYGVVGDTKNFVQEGISKEAEVPLTVGSKVKGKEDSVAECQAPNAELLNLMREQRMNTNDTAHEKSTELKEQPNDGSIHKRKRGRPKKLVIVSSQASQGAGELNGPVNVADKTAVEQRLDEDSLHASGGRDAADSQDSSRRNSADLSGTKAISNEATRTRVKSSENTDDDDRPLSTWFGGMQCPSNVDDLNKTAEKVKHASTPVDPVSETVPDENLIMPFVKSSPIWKAIESFDVFRKMPQNPHFRPLVKCKEEYREGFAIGNMVTFSSLVEKISSLHFDDPRQVFDSILESLLDLEKYGFTVTILRRRVNELLWIKERQGQFEGKSKDAESKIVEQSHEKSKLLDEADCIEKQMIELKEKHELIKAEIGAKERDIASLQLSVDAMNENIKNARTDFEKVASVPLT